MKSVRFVVLLLLFLAPVSLAQGVGGTHTLTRIAAGIFTAEPRFGGANSTIILTDTGVVIVDSHSSPAAANALIAEVRALTDNPVSHVINTHWHGDHHGGNRAFQKTFGDSISFISHVNTREDIATLATTELRRMASFYSTFHAKAETYLQNNRAELREDQRRQIELYIAEEKAFVADAQAFEYLLPDRVITKNLTLNTGGRELQLRYFQNAHTRGDIVVFLPAEKLMISGDLLTAPYIVPRSGYPKDYANTLRQVAELDFDQYVLGHGGPVKSDRAFIFTMAGFLEAVVAHAESTSGLGYDEVLEKAKSNTKLQGFNERIDWNEPGMRFLDFDRLLQMTLDRAYREILPKSAVP